MDNLINKIYEHPFITILLIGGIAGGISDVIGTIGCVIKAGELAKSSEKIDTSTK